MGKININKLDGINLVRTETQRDVKNPGKDTGLTIEKRPQVTGDKLDISSRASEVGRLVDQIKALPDVRQDKVNTLKEQIAAGTYKPSGESIADALLKDISS